MSGNFFVLGLPRSRTAWLANFLTYDGLFCYHEGLAGCSSIAEYKEKLKYGKGDSCTGLMFFDIQHHFPDARLVIIDRDPRHAIRYGEKTYGSCEADTMIKGHQILQSLPGLHIAFDDINDKLRDIWEYVSDAPFNQERADMLIKTNIQIHDPHSFDMGSMLELLAAEQHRLAC